LSNITKLKEKALSHLGVLNSVVFFLANKGFFGTKRPRLNWLDFTKKKKANRQISIIGSNFATFQKKKFKSSAHGLLPVATT
jgi:hypothetical protein